MGQIENSTQNSPTYILSPTCSQSWHDTILIQHILPQTRHTDTGHTLRNANNSTTILTKTTSFYRSFVPNTTRQWNLLPETMRSETSTNKFKKQLSELYGALHPPDFYLAGSKTGNADHTKIRCGSFELNSYLHQIQKSNSPACACGYRIENTSHFVLHCPIYQRIRAELFGNISMILNFNFSSLPSSEKLSILLDGVSLDTGSGRLVARHFQNYLQEAKQLRWGSGGCGGGSGDWARFIIVSLDDKTNEDPPAVVITASCADTGNGAMS